MKMLKVFFGVLGALLLVVAYFALTSNSPRLNSATTVLGLMAQVSFVTALAIHLSGKKKGKAS